MNNHRPLLLILLAYLALGLAYSLVVPLGEAPDEVDHVRYIQLLAQKRTFPVMSPRPEENLTMESNQPPLYYLLGALAWGNTGQAELIEFDFAPCFVPNPADPGRDQFYLHTAAEAFPFNGLYASFWRVRLLGLLLGGATVALAYLLGRQLAGDGVGALAAALVAFNPQFLFITASANNDNLTAPLGAAIVAAAVLVATRPDWRRVALLGLLLGLSALTKLALLALWPVAFVALLPAVWPLRRDWRAAGRYLLRRVAVLLVVPLLVAGWWYVRAQRLYGDPLVWDVHLSAKFDSIVRLTPFTWADLGDFIRLHFQSYWATFGWLNVQPPPAVFWLLGLLLTAGLLGLALTVWRRRGEQTAVNIAALLLNTLAVAGIYLSLLRYIQTINWSGYQGRLAFAVIAPLAALLALGLLRLGGRWLGMMTGGGLALLAVGCLLFVLRPAYSRPEIYTLANIPEHTCARMAGWQLEGVSLPQQVRPGETLPLTLHGYGLQDAAQGQVANLSLQVELVGRQGEIVGREQVDVSVQAGRPVSVTLSLEVDEAAQPARALLRAGALDTNGNWLPVTHARGENLESPYPVALVKIAPSAPITAMPQYPACAQFGEALALLGYDVAQPDEQTLDLTLYWQAINRPDEDYTFFVHVLDAAGQVLSQWDGQPDAGAYPTSIWDPGEVVVIPLQVQLPAGAHQVAVGVYGPPTGERLPLQGTAGDPTNRYFLDGLTLEDDE